MKANAPAEEAFSRVGQVAEDLEFTGERIVPGKTEEAVFREHEERYVFAGRYVAGKDVLDVACGTGIGTAYLLHAGARSCAGVDIDKGAIDYAEANYKGCMFAQSNATELPLPDASVHVVVSFETIEHVRNQEQFLEECRRVLRPGGLLICSTPNQAIFRWDRRNPFHLCELTPHEFIGLVGTHFADLSLFAQAEKIYPLHVVRRLTSDFLERLSLKRAIKGLLGLRTVPDKRRRCSFCDGNASIEIRHYRQAWFIKPVYMIAVCRKGEGG